MTPRAETRAGDNCPDTAGGLVSPRRKGGGDGDSNMNTADDDDDDEDDDEHVDDEWEDARSTVRGVLAETGVPYRAEGIAFAHSSIPLEATSRRVKSQILRRDVAAKANVIQTMGRKMI